MIRFLEIFIITIYVLFISCSLDDNPSKTNVIEIDIYQTPAKQTDFIDEWHYVKLETRDNEAMIGEISSFDIDDDNILIVSNMHDAFVYDHDGRLVSAFNRHGQGPNEYISIEDAHLSNDNIWILSREAKSLVQYDLYGHGINTYHLPDWFFSFQLIDNNTVILFSDKGSLLNYNFIIYDLQKGCIINKFQEFSPNTIQPHDMGFNPFITNESDQINFVDMFDYNVYGLTDDNKLEIKRQYKINTPFQPDNYIDKDYDEISHECFINCGVEFLGKAYNADSLSLQSFHLFDNRLRKDYVYRYDERTGKGDLIECVISEDFPFLALAPLAFYKGWYITAIELRNIEFVENKFGKKYIEGVKGASAPSR